MYAFKRPKTYQTSTLTRASTRKWTWRRVSRRTPFLPCPSGGVTKTSKKLNGVQARRNHTRASAAIPPLLTYRFQKLGISENRKISTKGWCLVVRYTTVSITALGDSEKIYQNRVVHENNKKKHLNSCCSVVVVKSLFVSSYLTELCLTGRRKQPPVLPILPKTHDRSITRQLSSKFFIAQLRCVLNILKQKQGNRRGAADQQAGRGRHRAVRRRLVRPCRWATLHCPGRSGDRSFLVVAWSPHLHVQHITIQPEGVGQGEYVSSMFGLTHIFNSETIKMVSNCRSYVWDLPVTGYKCRDAGLPGYWLKRSCSIQGVCLSAPSVLLSRRNRVFI